jgi:mannose-6-phosphate isomerase
VTPLYPLRLPASLRQKIWGARDLSPIFEAHENPIGEAWFSYEENAIANGPLRGRTLGELVGAYGKQLMGSAYAPSSLKRRAVGEAAAGQEQGPSSYFPILTKLLFTSARLSVQVHPNDEYALQHEGGPGKTEMWYVVAAQPGASVALGLRETLPPDTLREAAETGEIERYLHWVEVRPGQAVFVPSGTLHAIGPGLVLCEIQQNSDLTYRFYDFGRLGDDGKPRALHIDPAVRVTRQYRHPGPLPPFRFEGDGWNRKLLAACPYFAAEHLQWSAPLDYPVSSAHADLLIFLQGSGQIGSDPYAPGDGYLIPSEAEPFALKPSSPTAAIRTYVPDLEELQAELTRAGAGEDDLQRLVSR